jgi:F-type H+-transporting ATPase subunit gamma
VANLADIKRRIVSIENTQKITSAMKMVAAAKLRRAHRAVEDARPYATNMRETLQEIAAGETEAENPLLDVREEVEKVSIVVVTSDRGLAGAFNNQVLKAAERLVVARMAAGQQVELTLIGRRAGDFFRRRRGEQIVHDGITGPQITYAQAAEAARTLCNAYTLGETDEVLIVFNEFVSTMTQVPVERRLLPIAPDEVAADATAGAGDESEVGPYTIEPDAQALLATLAPKAVEVEIFQALLENQAGEHAARMTAMESATKNTEELIEKLTLEFNRARQAAITRELVEIVTGAQAIEG